MIEKEMQICYYMAMDNLSKEFYERFDKLEHEADELTEMLSAVEIMSDHKLYNYYLKKYKSIESISSRFKRFKNLEKDIKFIKEMLKSEANDELVLELDEMKSSQVKLLDEMKSLYASLKEKISESVSIEISSKEDLEFVGLLKEMFVNFAKTNSFEIESAENGDSVLIKIIGTGAYADLKTFSGKIKKVDRGVETNALIVVLKSEKLEIEIKDEDLEIQTSRSGGAGGQHINKTESAVKIIHLPTGISAECQDERSQGKNKEKAMQALMEKITQKQTEKQQKNIKKQRIELRNKIFASTPEMIFDFDANKVTINKAKQEYKLKEILMGNLLPIINNQID